MIAQKPAPSAQKPRLVKNPPPWLVWIPIAIPGISLADAREGADE
jgi:hypothetical protein